MSALLSGLRVKPVCQFTDLCQITMPYVNCGSLITHVVPHMKNGSFVPPACLPG